MKIDISILKCIILDFLMILKLLSCLSYWGYVSYDCGMYWSQELLLLCEDQKSLAIAIYMFLLNYFVGFAYFQCVHFLRVSLLNALD